MILKVMKKVSDLMNLKTNISNISNRAIIRVILISILFYLTLRVIYNVRGVLILIGIAFFLALALNPPVSWLAKRITKGSRGLATGVSYLAVIGMLSLLLYFVIPPLIDQTKKFVDNAPTYIENLKNSDSKAAELARKYNIPEQLDSVQGSVKNNLSKAGGPIFQVIKRVLSSVAAMITILVLTFFMLIEGPHWFEIFFAMQPANKQKHYRELAGKMYQVVTGYVNGQLFIAALGATSAFIVMSILKFEYALPLAGIVFFLNLIPLVGATLAGVMMATIGLFKSVTVALILVVYLVVYQQLENSFVQPRVQAKVTNISPLTVLISAIIGGAMAGLLGALVAIPVAACARILLLDYIGKDDTLRDRLSTAAKK